MGLYNGLLTSTKIRRIFGIFLRQKVFVTALLLALNGGMDEF